MGITLRPYQVEDAERLSSLANNYNVARFLTNRFPHPYTIQNALDFIKNFSSENPLKVFAIDLDGVLIGGIGLHPQEDIFSNNAEIGYWLGEAYWGKGYMPEALKLMIKYAFDNFQVNRLYCRVYGNNPKSMKVLQKCRFIEEAVFKKTLLKFGEELDEHIFAYRKMPSSF